MNPFYQAPPVKQNPLMQMVSQIKADPFSFLAKSKLNVPSNVGNDANSIIQHLLTTGQVTQDQVNWAMQKAREIQS